MNTIEAFIKTELNFEHNKLNDFNLKHEQKECKLKQEFCNQIMKNINNPSPDIYKSLEELFDYGFMYGYQQACVDNLHKDDELYDYANRIDFLLDNLDCVRISIKGNTDIVPSQETVDNALFANCEAIRGFVDNIRKIVT